MQNDICIIEVKLNAQKVFLSHKFTCKDTCATHQLRHRWRFAWSDATQKCRYCLKLFSEVPVRSTGTL